MMQAVALADARAAQHARQYAPGATARDATSIRPLRFGTVSMALAQATPVLSGRVRFGSCVLDEGRGVLCAPDGTETLLRPKTLELLRLLLRNPGRVVARGEILDAVWPGLFVTDDSITQCVVEIRKAMGGGGAEMLKTIPRRGYLLQAEVEPEGAAAARAALPEDRPSIAVLPFRKDGADAEEAYFADGIVEGIVHVLSGLDRIVVVSRGSALAVAEGTPDPREVGRKLGVRYVLYGGVRRAGARLRITTELSEAESGAVLRADRHEGDTADIFALQDRIADSVAATVVPELRERELGRALRKPASSLTAYDLVLRALDQARRVEPAAHAAARALLEEALRLDPGSALARAQLALLHMLDVAEGWAQDLHAAYAEAADLSRQAMELDPADPLAIAIHAHTLSYLRRDYAAAWRLLEKAMRLGPSCAWAFAWGSATAGYLGQAADAVRLAAIAVRLSPFDPFLHMFEHLLSQAHYLAGEHEEAVRWALRSAAANPRHAPNQRVLVASLVALGRMDQARVAAARIAEGDPAFRLGAFAARTPLPPGVREAFCDRLRQAGLPD